MIVLFRFIFLTLLLYIQKSDADCTDFRKQCTEFCLGRSGGVENNQCWGSPKYRYCICSDNYIYFVPGYTCEHPTCPTAVVEDGTTKAPLQRNGVGANRKPVRRDPPTKTTDFRLNNPNLEFETVPIITEGCQDFRAQCSALCNTNVENDECWGFPKFRRCECTTGIIHSIPGYPCEHPDCPKEKVVDGTTKAPIQRKRKPILRRRKPAQKKEDDCKDFRDKCSSVCGGDVESDQCWGFPKYRFCRCTDESVQLIPGYDCEHPDCKDCALDFGFGSCKQDSWDWSLNF